MKGYKCLNKQEYKTGDYQLVPIRDEDRYQFMEEWNVLCSCRECRDPSSIEIDKGLKYNCCHET